MLVPGGNAIRGSALIRQQGGGVVTCAGREVRLIPATAYARERMNLLYGSTTQGYNPAFMGRNLGEQAQNKEYLDATRRTTCDAQGFFRFDNVADGDYFVATAIVCQVRPYVSEGGALMHAVTLSGKEAKEIVLSPQ